jgi:predicted dehydrogenase
MKTIPPLKIAVVGVGAFGELHARTVAGLAEAELVALVDSREEHRNNLAQELEVPFTFSTLNDVLEASCAEAVIIATRTESHVPLAKEALNGGLHVLIEKPVGTTAAEVAELARFASSVSPIAMAGHICLFHSLVAPLVERVRNQGLRAVNFVRHRPATTAQVFREEHPVRMSMVHDLYVLAQMVNNEDPVVIEGLDAFGPLGNADMSWATLRWADGRIATLQAHWILPEGAPAEGWDETEVFGNFHHARIVTNPQTFIWTDEKVSWPKNLEISLLGAQPVGMLAEELRAFILACRSTNVPPGCRLSDGVQVQRWIEQIMQSAAARRQSTEQIAMSPMPG